MLRSAPLRWLFLLLIPLSGAQQQEAKPGLLELTDNNFVSTLKALPEDRWVLAEFYAHWCPACQHFQPEYEKVAAYFAERGEQEPVVTVVRVDCADHPNLCAKFDVGGYPSMRLGQAAELATFAKDRLTEVRPASRKANAVVAFLAKQLDVQLEAITSGSGSKGSGATSRKLDPGGKAGGGDAAGAVGPGGDGLQVQGQGQAGEGALTPGVGGGHRRKLPTADLNDLEGATTTSWKYITSSPLLLKGPEARQALKDWVDLLADNHPLDRCGRGAEAVQGALDQLWPDETDEPAGGLQELNICPGTDFKAWSGCKGSSPDRRGYTCGLWQLFHTLASRLPEAENSGAVWLAAVKGFIGNFFQCSECAKHFMRHAVGEEAVAVATKRDAVLWMWRTHNIVNRRLAAEEAADSSRGDPASPHVQFPPTSLCSKCRKAEGQGGAQEEAVPWDEDAVYDFLLSYYSGKQLAAAGTAGGGPRGRHSSWGDAALVALLVACCVYAALRRSGQYALRKSGSRSL